MNIHGITTNANLCRALGSMWELDIADTVARERFKTKFRFIMDERKGVLHQKTGTSLRIRRARFIQISDSKKRTSHYEIKGLIADEDIPHLIDRLQKRNEWEAFEDDELQYLLDDADAARISIAPSSIPPSSRL